MISAILKRRSIRKYKRTNVSRQMVEKIVQSGMLAPSSKNRQPWKFIVVTGNTKTKIINAMNQGLNREKERPLLPQSAHHLDGAYCTIKIMEQAPVIIFVVNSLGIDIQAQLNPEERIYEICNAQSIGAAMENMTLEATELGLGSLWICDTFFAYKELSDCLDVDGTLFAAMAIGYADEDPLARPRKEIEDIVQWRD